MCPTDATRRRERRRMLVALALLVALVVTQLEAIGLAETALAGFASIGLFVAGCAAALFGVIWRREPWTAWGTIVAATVVVSVFVSIPTGEAKVGKSQRRGDQVCTALLAFQQREGRLPSSLAELVPRDLPAVPPTAMGVLRSLPFHYAPGSGGFTLRFGEMAWTGWRRGPTTGWVWYD